MKQRLVLVAAMAFAGRAALGQTAAEHIALGDRDHAERNLASAIRHYEAAIAMDPKNVDALNKAAYDAVDLGEFNSSEELRKTLYRNAQEYARRAVEANPEDAEAHFQMARAIGRNALTMGTRDKIKYAGVVREHALRAIELNPKHSGALHVMGVWNAEVMRLNGISRMIAKNFLGGKVFGEASWDNGQRYLEQAVALDPNRITHHLDLGRVYKDRDDKIKAREQFEWIGKAPVTDFNDAKYKEEAERALKEVR